MVFPFTISILILTFKRSSDIYFLKSGDLVLSKSWPYQLISFIFGWWGIPWGPIYTIQSLYHGFAGKDVNSRSYICFDKSSINDKYRGDMKKIENFLLYYLFLYF